MCHLWHFFICGYVLYIALRVFSYPESRYFHIADIVYSIKIKTSAHTNAFFITYAISVLKINAAICPFVQTSLISNDTLFAPDL